MEYKDTQIDYSRRTIENYEKVYSLVQYEFTFITGTILAVLTALLPDDNIKVIDFQMGENALPYFDTNIYSDVKDYLRDIRNALAHKVDKNFMDLTKEGEIREIQLNTNRNRPIRLYLEDFEKILDYLRSEIQRHNRAFTFEKTIKL